MVGMREIVILFLLKAQVSLTVKNVLLAPTTVYNLDYLLLNLNLKVEF